MSPDNEYHTPPQDEGEMEEDAARAPDGRRALPFSRSETPAVAAEEDQQGSLFANLRPFAHVQRSTIPLDYSIVERDLNEIPEANDDSDEEDAIDCLFENTIERAQGFEDNAAAMVDNIPIKKELCTTTPGHLKLPTAPEGWKPNVPNEKLGEPPYAEVDNPGGWEQFTYRPVFKTIKKKKEYAYHALPTGVTPVPPDEIGDRKAGGWTFNYTGDWKSTATDVPRRYNELPNDAGTSAAQKEEMFPKDRRGYLDAIKFKALGMSKEIMHDEKYIWFWNQLLPIIDPAKSGVPGDTRMPYYTKVLSNSNIYTARHRNVGGTYGHAFKTHELKEHVNLDGVLMRNGVLGGDQALHLRWDSNDSVYDELIASTFTYERFCQLKQTMKLDDISEQRPRRTDKDYDPTYKYDYIYKCSIWNIRWSTKKAADDLCGDESTWAFHGYGEARSGVCSQIKGKPGVTRGGQMVFATDGYRPRPYVYMARHKMYEWPKEKGWTKAQGPNEVRAIYDMLEPMIGGGDGMLWHDWPHSTWDNHFSGDEIMDHLGSMGASALMTCRRDRLPGGVEEKFLHKKGVTYHHFRDVLSQQLIAWNPKKRDFQFAGVLNLRENTQKSFKRRKLHHRLDADMAGVARVSIEQTKLNLERRLCGDLCSLDYHCSRVP